MNIEISLQDVFYMLSPVGCKIEALSIALLFTAMIGCAVEVLV